MTKSKIPLRVSNHRYPISTLASSTLVQGLTGIAIARVHMRLAKGFAQAILGMKFSRRIIDDADLPVVSSSSTSATSLTFHSLFRQYYNLNVWFWNLSPWFIPNCPFVAQDQSPHQPNISLFDYKAASGADVGAGGSALRPFHPKFGGHWAIKDQIIKRLQDDNIPHVKPKDVKDAPPPCGAGSCNGGPIGERSFEG